MGALRRELFDSLGVERARGLLIRMGFASGQQDAELAKKLFGAATPTTSSASAPNCTPSKGWSGHHRAGRPGLGARQLCRRGGLENSWEADSHLQQFGIGEDPACWTLVGYASGYVTQFFNRLIVFAETPASPAAMPIAIVGKPAEAWGDDPYLDYFKPDNLQGQLDEMREEIAACARPCARPAGGQPDRRLAGLSRRLRSGQQGRRQPHHRAAARRNRRRQGDVRALDPRPRQPLRQPFVAVNCAAIPHDLLESELFGVQKGAYTGAQASRAGRFERAHGGTLFLDEVGDLPLAAQVKLLRVLQTGEVERLGDDQTRKIDAPGGRHQRGPAASHRAGRFRADLYYRLATYPVVIPPCASGAATSPAGRVPGREIRGLLPQEAPGHQRPGHAGPDGLPWPGNVRELQNLVERGVLLAPNGGLIEIDHLFAGGAPAGPGAEVDRAGQVGNAGDADRRLYEAILQDGFDLEKHEARLLELPRSGPAAT
jgi:hypothetical protein